VDRGDAERCGRPSSYDVESDDAVHAAKAGGAGNVGDERCARKRQRAESCAKKQHEGGDGGGSMPVQRDQARGLSSEDQRRDAELGNARAQRRENGPSGRAGHFMLEGAMQIESET
jgi:hypothetical protein